MHRPKNLTLATSVALLILLSACGGGGGGGSTNPPAPPTPRAANDTASVDEDDSITINVLSNDTRVTSSSIALGNAPGNGTATINGTSIDYTPDPDYFGTDSFGYTVDSTTGTSLNATVTVTINNVNDRPIAAADNIELLEDTPTVIAVTANDTDIDNDITSVSISMDPDNGMLTIDGTTVTYTPNLNYRGNDAFTYEAIDDDEATSNSVSVTITVQPITTTTLTVTNLAIPSADYTSANNTEYPSAVLTSPSQTLTIPPNTVSFSLTLRGPQVEVSEDESSLFIASLQSANDDISTFRRDVGFCDAGLCAAHVPRNPDLKATPGEWQFSLGTLSDTLTDIDLTTKSLDVAIRTGPDPDLSTDFPATLMVKPFLAGTGITVLELETILTRLVDIANSNAINMTLLPVTVIDDPRFAEVSFDFLDPTTAELVNMGEAEAVNLFFLDSFSGPNGGAILGVAGGIPGTQGITSSFNGVLTNALALHGGPTEFYTRNTAQISFHEMGHHLGLYHTTEGDFSFNDVLDDTPNCEQAADDDNDNGLADIDECPDASNPMFWKPDLLKPMSLTTDQQRHILFYTPIASP